MSAYSPTSFFDDLYVTGWVRGSQDKTTHIWELRPRSKPVRIEGSVCGEDVPYTHTTGNIVIQAEGVALDVVDCPVCLADWPVMHVVHLETRLQDFLATQFPQKTGAKR